MTRVLDCKSPKQPWLASPTFPKGTCTSWTSETTSHLTEPLCTSSVPAVFGKREKASSSSQPPKWRYRHVHLNISPAEICI